MVPATGSDNHDYLYALGIVCLIQSQSIYLGNSINNQKITKSIAFLLDLQTEQKQVTSHKMLQAFEFENEYPSLSLRDFKVFLSLCAELSARRFKLLTDGQIQLTQDGLSLREKMKLQPKSLNKIKKLGMNHLIDEMLLKLN